MGDIFIMKDDVIRELEDAFSKEPKKYTRSSSAPLSSNYAYSKHIKELKLKNGFSSHSPESKYSYSPGADNTAFGGHYKRGSYDDVSKDKKGSNVSHYARSSNTNITRDGLNSDSKTPRHFRGSDNSISRGVQVANPDWGIRNFGSKYIRGSQKSHSSEVLHVGNSNDERFRDVIGISHPQPLYIKSSGFLCKKGAVESPCSTPCNGSFSCTTQYNSDMFHRNTLLDTPKSVQNGHTNNFSSNNIDTVDIKKLERNNISRPWVIANTKSRSNDSVVNQHKGGADAKEEYAMKNGKCKTKYPSNPQVSSKSSCIAYEAYETDSTTSYHNCNTAENSRDGKHVTFNYNQR